MCCVLLCLRCLLSDLKQIHGICTCACAGTRNSVGGLRTLTHKENDKGLGGEIHTLRSKGSQSSGLVLYNVF